MKHWRAIKSWFFDAEQEVLRRELQYSLKVMRKPGLKAFFLAYPIVSFFGGIVRNWVLANVSIPLMHGSRFEQGLYAVFRPIEMLVNPATWILLAMWIYLIRSETFRYFRGADSSVSLTTMNSRNPWPAMLMIPLVFLVCSEIVQQLFYRVLAVFSFFEINLFSGAFQRLNDIFVTFPSNVTSSSFENSDKGPTSFRPAEIILFLLKSVLRPVLTDFWDVIEFSVPLFLITAIVVRKTFPYGRYRYLLIWIAIAYFFTIYAPVACGTTLLFDFMMNSKLQPSTYILLGNSIRVAYVIACVFAFRAQLIRLRSLKPAFPAVEVLVRRQNAA